MSVQSNGFGEKVKAERIRRFWSQKKLSTTSGVSVRTIQKLERGDIGQPQEQTALKLAAALEFDLVEAVA